MKTLLSIPIMVGFVFVLVAPVFGNPIPDPLYTRFDDYVGRSPVNEAADPSARYVFTGRLRSSSNMPIAGFPASQIELEILDPCPWPVVLHPIGPSNADGEVVWDAATLTQGGGACEPAEFAVEIRIYGAIFRRLDNVRSPDVDGDTHIALLDLVRWQDAFVTGEPLYVGDLDHDEVVALSDLVIWQKHFVADP
jgi:hypothetical protein